MLFSRKRNIVDLDVNISNTKIERKTESRFLGVIVDEKLNWSKHIHTLKSKMSKYIGVMCKLKFQIPLKARYLCIIVLFNHISTFVPPYGVLQPNQISINC